MYSQFMMHGQKNIKVRDYVGRTNHIRGNSLWEAFLFLFICLFYLFIYLFIPSFLTVTVQYQNNSLPVYSFTVASVNRNLTEVSVKFQCCPTSSQSNLDDLWETKFA